MGDRLLIAKKDERSWYYGRDKGSPTWHPISAAGNASACRSCRCTGDEYEEEAEGGPVKAGQQESRRSDAGKLKEC